MSLVIFDGNVLFENNEKHRISPAAHKLLGLPFFKKAAVLTGSSHPVFSQLDVIAKTRCFIFSGVADSVPAKEHILRNIAGYANANGPENVFVVAGIDSMDICFGKRLGFTTIGIPHSRSAELPWEPSGIRPNYTVQSLSEVPEIICRRAGVLALTFE